jgi:hypothetical protein
VHANEISDGSEAASGNVALFTLFVNLSSPVYRGMSTVEPGSSRDKWAARREEIHRVGVPCTALAGSPRLGAYPEAFWRLTVSAAAYNRRGKGRDLVRQLCMR